MKSCLPESTFNLTISIRDALDTAPTRVSSGWDWWWRAIWMAGEAECKEKVQSCKWRQASDWIDRFRSLSSDVVLAKGQPRVCVRHTEHSLQWLFIYFWTISNGISILLEGISVRKLECSQNANHLAECHQIRMSLIGGKLAWSSDWAFPWSDKWPIGRPANGIPSSFAFNLLHIRHRRPWRKSLVFTTLLAMLRLSCCRRACLWCHNKPFQQQRQQVRSVNRSLLSNVNSIEIQPKNRPHRIDDNLKCKNYKPRRSGNWFHARFITDPSISPFNISRSEQLD